MALSFQKEEVQPVIVTASLLSSTLASPRHDNPQHLVNDMTVSTETTRIHIPNTVTSVSHSFGTSGQQRTIFTVNQVSFTYFLIDNSLINIYTLFEEYINIFKFKLYIY